MLLIANGDVIVAAGISRESGAQLRAIAACDIDYRGPS
jgi:hypothetical protein